MKSRHSLVAGSALPTQTGNARENLRSAGREAYGHKGKLHSLLMNFKVEVKFVLSEQVISKWALKGGTHDYDARVHEALSMRATCRYSFSDPSPPQLSLSFRFLASVHKDHMSLGA